MSRVSTLWRNGKVRDIPRRANVDRIREELQKKKITFKNSTSELEKKIITISNFYFPLYNCDTQKVFRS